MRILVVYQVLQEHIYLSCPFMKSEIYSILPLKKNYKNSHNAKRQGQKKNIT